MGFQSYRYDPQQPDKREATLPVSQVADDVALKLYRAMLRLRQIELDLIDEYHPADEMRCPIHFCVGQEAVSASLSLLLKDEDYLFSHHRSHGYYFGKRAPINALFAELYGRATGANGGKAGSQDISYGGVNFFSGAILAGATAISAGAALSFQNKGLPYVSVAGFGEGATDEGVFWETVNFAALRNLPLVLICENNRYATYSPQDKRSALDNIAERVDKFGVKSQTIFGNDVVKVYLTLQEAIDHARSGKGPVFVEAYTFRWNSHVGPEDDGHIGYRPVEELDYWKAHDPLQLMEDKLFAAGSLDETVKSGMLEEIGSEIAAAFQFAKNSPFPEPGDWDAWNLATSTPVADKFLSDSSSAAFDHDQADHIPAPY